MLTAAAATAIINIEPENLLRMMDLPLSCSMLLFAMNSRRLRMVTVFGIGNIAERPPTVRAHVVPCPRRAAFADALLDRDNGQDEA